MSVPVAALDGGAGGNPLDSPGTSPGPGSVTAPLGDSAGGGGTVAGDSDQADAPIPFPGEEDDEAAAAQDEDEEMRQESAAQHVGSSVAPGEATESSDVAGPSIPAGGSEKSKGKGKSKSKKAEISAEASAAAAKAKADKKVPAGTCQLPTARVKKIIMSDPDVDSCGKEATFAIGKACEIYIHHLVDAAYTQARLDKRKAVVYKDVAKAIRNTPHLEFLMDVVPTSMPLSQALLERQRHSDFAAALETGLAGDETTNGGDSTMVTNDDESRDLAQPKSLTKRNGKKLGSKSKVTASATPTGDGMDLDPTSANQLERHGLPPSTARATGSAVRDRVGSVEDIEDEP
ncbi:unnamed protein product [Sympodiomycopsis kandeliae]